jgi:hypothetical protein
MKNLFNPFRYIAGTKALVLGVIFIVSSGFMLYSNDMIQDSYVHIGLSDVALWQVMAVQFVWWLIPAILLYAGGLMLSKSKIRIIDVLGTTAFSQLILIPMIAPMMLPVVKNGSQNVINALLAAVRPETGDLMAVMLYGLWSTLFLVLFYVWNYNAFATSCNIKGTKAIVYFIAVQVVVTIVGSIL